MERVLHFAHEHKTMPMVELLPMPDIN